MSGKDREAKLNEILKKNKGKLDFNMIRKSKDFAVLQRQKPQKAKKPASSKTKIGSPRDVHQLTSAPEFFKPKLDMVRYKDKVPTQGQYTYKFKNYKPYPKYSSEPFVPLERTNPTDEFGYTAEQAASGLHAADMGYPSTYNGKLAMLSNKHVKPDVYRNLYQTKELLPAGYRAALAINIEREKQKEEAKFSRIGIKSDSLPVQDELKDKRNQITVDFNSLLRKIGNLMLKENLGQLGEMLVGPGFAAVSDNIISSLPDRVDFMNTDMDAMSALVTGLNNTNKAVLIIDQIYISAMLTMFLNEYNRKNIRDTTFLLRPFGEIRAFTDAETMFSSGEYYHKIDTLRGYNYAGTDLVYIDLSLMREYTFHILTNLFANITHTLTRTKGFCQVIVKTNLDLGYSESQFFSNMGLAIFDDLFRNLLHREGIDPVYAFNMVTGRKGNGEYMGELHDSMNNFKQELSARDEQERNSREREKEREIENLEIEINKIDSMIYNYINAAIRAYETSQIGQTRHLLNEADKLRTVL